MLQQLTASGFTGRHQPRTGNGVVDEETGEEQMDPRYLPAQDALERGDIDAAVAEYQKLVDANPADAEAAAGLAMAQLLKRTEGVDLDAARAAAAANPDDVDAQTMVADLDLLGGHVEDAFNRLVDVVRRTTDADRDTARTHLIAPVRRRRQRGPAGAARPTGPRLRPVLSVSSQRLPGRCAANVTRPKRSRQAVKHPVPSVHSHPTRTGGCPCEEVRWLSQRLAPALRYSWPMPEHRPRSSARPDAGSPGSSPGCVRRIRVGGSWPPRTRWREGTTTTACTAVVSTP